MLLEQISLALICCGEVDEWSGTRKMCIREFPGMDKVFPFKITDTTLNFGDFCKTGAPTVQPTAAPTAPAPQPFPQPAPAPEPEPSAAPTTPRGFCTDSTAKKFVGSLPSALNCTVDDCSPAGIKAKCSIPLHNLTTISKVGRSYTLVKAKLQFDFTLSVCSQPAAMARLDPRFAYKAVK